jgi:phosphoribosylformylglycinamidine synthase
VRLEIYAPETPPAGDVLVVPHGLGGAPAPDALEALRAFARAGRTVLGVGSGVRWLCLAGLLPGDVADEAGGDETHVRVEGRATAFTWAIPAGRIVPLAASAARARWAASDADVRDLAANGRIVLRYCDSSGGLARASARAQSVAGLCDESGRVVGLLGPSAAALDDDLGRQIMSCLRSRAVD